MLNIKRALEADGIFETEIAGHRFLYKLLTVREYRILASLRASGIVDEWSTALEALKYCYLGDARLFNQNLPAGVFISVGRLIMYLSGDCEGETVKEDIVSARASYPGLSIQEIMKHTIFVAFPSYTIEDAESWTRQELIRKFVIAEHALTQRGLGYQPLNVDEIKPYSEIINKDSVSPSAQTVDVANLDFDKAASEEIKHTGFWDSFEIAEETQKKKLTTAQARALDKIKQTKR